MGGSIRQARRALTTDASLTAIEEQRSFFVEEPVTLVLGPDESLESPIAATGIHFVEETIAHWTRLVRQNHDEAERVRALFCYCRTAPASNPDWPCWVCAELRLPL